MKLVVYNYFMETTVSQMSVSELRKLISDVVSDVVEEKLAQYADPDAGLEFREDFVDLIKRQDERIRNGERGTPLEKVMEELGL